MAEKEGNKVDARAWAPAVAVPAIRTQVLTELGRCADQRTVTAVGLVPVPGSPEMHRPLGLGVSVAGREGGKEVYGSGEETGERGNVVEGEKLAYETEANSAHAAALRPRWCVVWCVPRRRSGSQ